MIAPTYITPEFAVAPALEPADFPALAAQGVKTIICNLPDGEQPDQMASSHAALLALQNDMAFGFIPADKIELLTLSTINATEATIRQQNGPILAYCKSGMRSAIIWGAASARNNDVDCVLSALSQAGFDLDFLRDDFIEQRHARRWPATTPALDCRESILPDLSSGLTRDAA